MTSRRPNSRRRGTSLSARLLLIALVSAPLAPAGRAVASQRPDPRPIRAILTFKDDIPSGIESELTALGARGAMMFESIDSITLTASMSVLEKLADDPRVDQLRAQRQLDFTLYASVDQINAQGLEEPQVTGSKKHRGLPGVTGAGQTIAVVDTGIWSGHPDLLGQVDKHLNFELQYAHDVGAFTPDQRDIAFLGTGPLSNADTWGHGTHVAGIAAGTGAMAVGRENHGVAPGASLVSLKVGDVWNGFPQDAGWEANSYAALDWILRHHDDPEFGPHGIKVVNNSWTLMPEDFLFGTPRYDPLAKLIRQIVAEGVTMVFAAGNSGPNSVVPVPNGMPEVITVGNACKGIDSCGLGNIAGDSSTGPAVDVVAPGTDIMSTYLPPSLIGALKPFFGGNYGDTTEEQAQNNAFYTVASGTSMAAPHVAGLVALMLEANPKLSPSEIQNALTGSATDYGPEGRDDEWGAGLVNARGALHAVYKKGKSSGHEGGCGKKSCR